MGPFPHDAAPPAISDENPMGTDGFEFVEFCHPDPGALDRLFKVMGFSPVAKHRSKDGTLYRQGDVNFILNAEPQSFAARVGPQGPGSAGKPPREDWGPRLGGELRRPRRETVPAL